MVRGCLGARFSDEAEWRAFAQGCRTSSDRRRFPEFGSGFFGLLEDLHLIQQFGDDDVPAADRHDGQDDQGSAWHEAAVPDCGQAERVVHFFGFGWSCCVCCWSGCICGNWCWCCCSVCRRSRSGSRCWRVSECRSCYQSGSSGDGQQNRGKKCGQTGILKHASSKIKNNRSLNVMTTKSWCETGDNCLGC